MQTIINEGSFDSTVRTAVNSNFVLLQSLLMGGSAFADTYWVDITNGHDYNDGLSPQTPFKTIAYALSKVANFGAIGVVGNAQETGLTLTDSNVTIFGAGPTPRAFRWKSNSSSTPVIDVQGGSCRLANIWFEAPTAASAIRVNRNSGNAQNLQVVNCEFNTGLSGVESYGGCSGVRIYNCVFHDITAAGSPGAIVSTSSAVASPLRWIIEGCKFINNANHIVLPGNDCVVKDCVIEAQGNSITATSKIDLSGGTSGRNLVMGCYFGGTFSHIGGYQEGSNDNWYGNYASTGVTSALPA